MSCGTKGQLSYYVWQSWIELEITFILASFYLLKPLSDEGGEETGVLRETPDDKLQKMPHTKARKFKPKPRLEPAL